MHWRYQDMAVKLYEHNGIVAQTKLADNTALLPSPNSKHPQWCRMLTPPTRQTSTNKNAHTFAGGSPAPTHHREGDGETSQVTEQNTATDCSHTRRLVQGRSGCSISAEHPLLYAQQHSAAPCASPPPRALHFRTPCSCAAPLFHTS